MTSKTLILALALLVLSFVSLPATTARMPIDEVQPGMTGVGITVFTGAQREEFKVSILGVLQNVIGPRRNLILARLEGGPLSDTGVIAGMSGSPVYVDGRLVGAISYSLGQFSKEPIAGITPVDEMTESGELQPSRRVARGGPSLELPVSTEGLAASLRETFERMRPFADQPGDVTALGLPAATAGQLGALLHPIATPLVMGGFDGDTTRLLSGAFAQSGFVPVVGGSAAAAFRADADAPLQPGDAVGVSLITGDLSLGGVGTVTLVDEDRVYAFGHPFFNLGATEFPMNRAYVQTLLPSLFTSQKIATIGNVIGTFRQDRATAISGTLGKGPVLVPITLSLDTSRGFKKDFRFDVVNDQMLTPLMVYSSVVSALRAYEREAGVATFTVTGKTIVKGHTAVAFDDVFAGDMPSTRAASYITAPLTFLLGNDLEQIEIQGLDLRISSVEERRVSTIERVWLDDMQLRPGRTVPLKVMTRTYRGEETVRTIPIEIPANASGTLSILVADGSRLAQWEQRELRQSLRAQNIEQLIRTLNGSRKNNRLYVRLLSPQLGAVVSGEPLSSLPPSVLSVFESDRSSGNFVPIRSATIGAWEFPTDNAVSGSRLLTITVGSE